MPRPWPLQLRLLQRDCRLYRKRRRLRVGAIARIGPKVVQSCKRRSGRGGTPDQDRYSQIPGGDRRDPEAARTNSKRQALRDLPANPMRFANLRLEHNPLPRFL